MRSICRTRPNIPMEILESAPTDSRHNTSNPKLDVLAEWKYSGNEFPLYFHLIQIAAVQEEINRKYVSASFPLPETHIANRDNIMPGKPHQSVLVPHEEEILALRNRRPPTPYRRIAEILLEKHGVSVQPPAVFKFIKVRSRGRKVFSYSRSVPATKPSIPKPCPSATKPPVSPQPKDFNMPFSENYNLHILSPEAAAALQRQLEEEENQ
ncbi:MAG: hypothetical protein LBP68_00295 [Acidobacteriota bacterium]|jgi:hypothetical protein|nr:hypothetical protein [Acidobacteriota bacterium]